MKAREKLIPPVNNFRVPEALDRLVELYTATGKPDEVKKWRAERAKYPNVAPPPREKRNGGHREHARAASRGESSPMRPAAGQLGRCRECG